MKLGVDLTPRDCCKRYAPVSSMSLATSGPARAASWCEPNARSGRQLAPDVSIRSDIGFGEGPTGRLVDDTLDIRVMYTPTRAPKLIVEHLFADATAFDLEKIHGQILQASE